MEGEVMAEVAKEQAEDDRREIAHGDGGVDENLLIAFHGQDLGHKVDLDGDDGHGDGVIEHDDAAFTVGLHQIHPQHIDGDVAHAPFDHRAGKRTPNSRYQSDYGDGYQRQPSGGAEEVVKTCC